MIVQTMPVIWIRFPCIMQRDYKHWKGIQRTSDHGGCCLSLRLMDSMIKRVLYTLGALMVLAAPLTGCQSSAKPVSRSAKPASTRADHSQAGNANGPEALTDNTPFKLPLADPRIEVRKAERRLLLFSNGRLVRTYHVGL